MFLCAKARVISIYVGFVRLVYLEQRVLFSLSCLYVLAIGFERLKKWRGLLCFSVKAPINTVYVFSACYRPALCWVLGSLPFYMFICLLNQHQNPEHIVLCFSAPKQALSPPILILPATARRCAGFL